MDLYTHGELRWSSAACIGDCEASKEISEKIVPAIEKAIKCGCLFFVTRGKSGFEYECACAVREFKKRFSRIQICAIIEQPDAEIFGKEIYDYYFCPHKVNISENDIREDVYKYFFADYASYFIVGPITESKNLVISIIEKNYLVYDLSNKVSPQAKHSVAEYIKRHICDVYNYNYYEDISGYEALEDVPYDDNIDYQGYDEEEIY